MQAMNGVAPGCVGAQVLQASEALLEVAVEDRVDLPLVFPSRHRSRAKPEENPGADRSGDQQDCSGPEVDGEGDGDHPDGEARVADDVHEHVGEEDHHRLDVAVDAFDELTRAVPPVPGHLQVHRVLGQPLTEPVSGFPGELH